MKRFRLAGAVLVAALAWNGLSPGLVHAQSAPSMEVQVTLLSNRANQLDSYLSEQDPQRRRIAPYTERFADAELLYQLRDYARASVLFTDIVNRYGDSPAFPNSLFLLAESLYQAGDRRGALERFREVVNHVGDPLFRPYVQRSLGRIIEIAIRTRNFDGIEEIFARLNQLPPAEIEPQIKYVRGKFFYFRQNPDYEQARAAFEQVPEKTNVYAQARYFLGAIHTQQQHYAEAIQAFEQVLKIESEGDADRQHVLDLAALSVGILKHEKEDFDGAAAAFNLVENTSPIFDKAMYNLAWTYIKSGDTVRAEQSLDLLAIAAPESPLVADAKLLRGNLLLRTGRFDDAEKLFQDVRTQFGPINQEISRLFEPAPGSTQAGSKILELIRSDLQAFDFTTRVPPEALSWMRSRSDSTLDEAIELQTDLKTCREYIRDSQELIQRLKAAIDSPVRSQIFPDLRRAKEQAAEILNRVTQARSQIAHDLEQQFRGGDMDPLVSEHQGYSRSIAALPTSQDQFHRRDQLAENEINNLSQELQRMQIQIEYLEGVGSAVEHYMDDPSHQVENATGIRDEISQQRTLLTTYRARSAELRRLIIMAQSQIGPGDPRYAHDRELLNLVGDILRREVAIARSQGGLSAGVDALLTKLDETERTTTSFMDRVDTVVDRRIVSIREEVLQEERNVESYVQRLQQLEGEAADRVGLVILQNFRDVQIHFTDILMRADLGIGDVSWQRREEHTNRQRMLDSERNREISTLRAEFGENHDDEDSRPARPAPTPPSEPSNPNPTGSGTTPEATPSPAPAGTTGATP